MSTLGGHRLVPIRPSPMKGMSSGKPPPPFTSSASQSPSSFTPPNSAVKRKYSDDESDDSDTESCKRKINFAVNYLMSPPPVSISRRNARERNRVKQVNNGFAALRQHIPSVAKAKKISKVDTLKQAVEYIQNLQQLLTENDKALVQDQQLLNSDSFNIPNLASCLQESAGMFPGQEFTAANFFPKDFNMTFPLSYTDDENMSPMSTISSQTLSPEPLNSVMSPDAPGTTFSFPNTPSMKGHVPSQHFTPYKPTLEASCSSPLLQATPAPPDIMPQMNNLPKEINQRHQPQQGVQVHSYNKNGPQAALPVSSVPFTNPVTHLQNTKPVYAHNVNHKHHNLSNHNPVRMNQLKLPPPTTENGKFKGVPPEFPNSNCGPETCASVALAGDVPPDHFTNIDCDIASNFPNLENLEEVYKTIDTSHLVEDDLLNAIDLWEKC